MRRIISIFVLVILCYIHSGARDMVIIKLNQSPIRIGNRSLKVGDTFSDSEVIHWSSSKQKMKVLPKSGGGSIQFYAEAFKLKSRHDISIKQYIEYTRKTNNPSTLDAGELYLQRSENSDKFPEKRIALIVGNSLYSLLGRNLICPINDAEDVTSTLNELGFDTYTLYDATSAEMYSALMKFSNVASAEEYEVALFYFCGHGSQNDDKNYLLPVNARNDALSDTATWISFDAVFESLSETGCKAKLAYLDACRNSPRWHTQNVTTPLNQYDTMGSLVVYSTANNSVALGEQEEEAQNTPFGAAFLESVMKPAENVSLTNNSISELVSQRTEYYKQYGESPQQVNLFGVGNIDFSFVPIGFETEYNKTKRYISESNPEMAIICLNKIKEYQQFLDSESIQKYQEAVAEVNELMLKTRAYNESIHDTIFLDNFLPNKYNINYLWDFPSYEDGLILDYYDSTKIDTLQVSFGEWVPSNNGSFIAISEVFLDTTLYKLEFSESEIKRLQGLNNNLPDYNNLFPNHEIDLLGYTSICGRDRLHLDIIPDIKDFLPEFENGLEDDGISGLPPIDTKIISLKDGTVNSFVLRSKPGGSYINYPIAISNDGNQLIYQETIFGVGSFIFIKNLSTTIRKTIHIKYEQNFDYYKGAFSTDEELFFLFNMSTKEITVYDTNSLGIIYTFKYNSVDKVFWRGSDLCISSNGYAYTWSFSNQCFLKTYKIPQSVIAVAISSDNNLTAALSNNGSLYVFNSDNNEQVHIERYMSSPADLEFTPDNRNIWTISNEYEISCFDLSTHISQFVKKRDFIFDVSDCYLFFTNDNKYCVSDYGIGSRFKIFDVSSLKEIEYDADLISHIFSRQKVSDIFLPTETSDISEKLYESIGKVDYPLFLSGKVKILTARKVSLYKSTIVEGYSDGEIKVWASNPPNSFILRMILNQGI